MPCTQCLKSPELCVCASIRPLSARTQILILQHPQEPDHELGSARITQLSLPNATLKIGLSWPNLSAALGQTAQSSQWGVLYLGSGIKGEKKSTSTLQFVTKQSAPAPAPPTLTGFVILDGTWSQAKALWWRNAWLLKLKRAVLTPTRKSLYRELRKEPRNECLSTIESVAELFDALGEAPETSDSLRSLFSALLDKKRTLSGKSGRRS
jgi:DTW domain-containing protein